MSQAPKVSYIFRSSFFFSFLCCFRPIMLIARFCLLLCNLVTVNALLLQKTVVAVQMLCTKCKKKVMKLTAGIEGINSITLDSLKGLVTIVGDADPVHIIRNIRKFSKSAAFVSIGPFKEEAKEEKKPVVDPPRTCQKCDAWFIIRDDDYYYNYCSIL
ncbi:putative heavy metal-associated domain, HMA, heavy metal-associated domain superfamily [Dioscorea sansibarensis]